jgi:hypothetical protein
MKEDAPNARVFCDRVKLLGQILKTGLGRKEELLPEALSRRAKLRVISFQDEDHIIWRSPKPAAEVT